MSFLQKILSQTPLTIKLKDGRVLDVHSNKEEAPSSLEQWMDDVDFKTTEAFALGAFDGEKLVGSVLLWDEFDEIYSVDTFVEPEYRRQGIATALYDLAEELSGKKLFPGEQYSGSSDVPMSKDASKLWTYRNNRPEKKTKSAENLGDLIDDRYLEAPEDRQGFKDAIPFEGPWLGYGQPEPISALTSIVGDLTALSELVDPRYSENPLQFWDYSYDFKDYGGYAEGAAKSLTFYRGFKDLKPGQIKPFFKSTGSFMYGPGDYYGLSKKTAEYYAYKHANKFGVVVEYKGSPKLLKFDEGKDFTHENESGDFSYSEELTLTPTGQKKLKTKDQTLKGEQIAEYVAKAGYDGVLLQETGPSPLFEDAIVLFVKEAPLEVVSYSIGSAGDNLPTSLRKLGDFKKYPETGWNQVIENISPEHVGEMDAALKAPKKSGSTLDQIAEADFDERYFEPNSPYRHHFFTPVDQTYGWGLGKGMVTEPFAPGYGKWGGAFEGGNSKAALAMRTFAKATLPEGSDLLDFYYKADAEGWREEQREEFLREWELMDEDERAETIPDLISEGYSDHFPHEPANEDEWNEVRDYYCSMRERQEQDSADTTETFFENARILSSPTLVRFTDQDPQKILSEGFEGYGANNLGLTYHFRPSPNGTLAFAVDKKDLKKPEDWKHFQSKYGKNIFQFKVPYAVKAYHNSDGEDQVVFDIETVQDLKQVELPKAKAKPGKKPTLKKGEKIPF